MTGINYGWQTTSSSPSFPLEGPEDDQASAHSGMCTPPDASLQSGHMCIWVLTCYKTPGIQESGPVQIICTKLTLKQQEPSHSSSPQRHLGTTTTLLSLPWSLQPLRSMNTSELHRPILYFISTATDLLRKFIFHKWIGVLPELPILRHMPTQTQRTGRRLRQASLFWPPALFCLPPPQQFPHVGLGQQWWFLPWGQGECTVYFCIQRAVLPYKVGSMWVIKTPSLGQLVQYRSILLN